MMKRNIERSSDGSGSSSDSNENEDSDTESYIEDEDNEEVREEEKQQLNESDKLRQELADIPLGEVQKIRETIGLKKYSEAVFGSWKPQSQHSKMTSVAGTKEMKRKKIQSNKNDAEKEKTKSKKSEPEEKSSKVKIFRPRMVVNKTGRTRRDPRFDDLSGKLNEDLFQKSYAFVDDIRKEEQNVIKKQLKRVKDKEKKDELSELLKRMEHQDKSKQDAGIRKDKDRQRKKEEYESVKQGKKAFYLKKSDKKKIELAEKYRNLKESGGLEKYMGNKMKRNASKEKRKLPYMKT